MAHKSYSISHVMGFFLHASQQDWEEIRLFKNTLRNTGHYPIHTHPSTPISSREDIDPHTHTHTHTHKHTHIQINNNKNKTLL